MVLKVLMEKCNPKWFNNLIQAVFLDDCNGKGWEYEWSFAKRKTVLCPKSSGNKNIIHAPGKKNSKKDNKLDPVKLYINSFISIIDIYEYEYVF